jgi:hypothetical protein
VSQLSLLPSPGRSSVAMSGCTNVVKVGLGWRDGES